MVTSSGPRVSVKTAPPGVPTLDALLWHLDAASMLRISDAIEKAEDRGMAVDRDEGPVFFEAYAPLLGAPSGLGGLCAIVNDTIRDHFAEYDLPVPPNLRTMITTGAMIAGDYNAALGYLMRWVGIVVPGDDD